MTPENTVDPNLSIPGGTEDVEARAICSGRVFAAAVNDRPDCRALTGTLLFDRLFFPLCQALASESVTYAALSIQLRREFSNQPNTCENVGENVDPAALLVPVL